MPSSNPDSTDSPPPSATRSVPPSAAPARWRINAWLFAATVASVAYAGFDGGSLRDAARNGAAFAASLLSILVAHEFGHYIAARIHKVDASLPYFIPMPLSPFGTMGAVIRMRGTIPTRRALLDIGASGPLAGLALAIPLYAWGAAHSTFAPMGGLDAIELGDSLLLRGLDHLFAPTPPPGMELMLSPVAFGAWAGFFVTMINLIPASQLDGGHVAYALFGTRQDAIARWVHRSMLAFFFVSLGSLVFRDLRAGFGFVRIGAHVGSSFFWLSWFEMLAIIGALSTRKEHGPAPGELTIRTRVVALVGLLVLASVGHDHGKPILWIAWFLGLALLLAMEVHGGALKRNSGIVDHPPTGAEALDPVRRAIAIVTLAFFVLLFMPTPMTL